MKSAAQILREAAEVIEERGKLRDTEEGERSMSRAVAAYNALCGDSMEGELQGWLFMCCLKLARATAGSTHIDDYTDLCGYAALAAECVSKEASKESEWNNHTGRGCPSSIGLYDVVEVHLRNGKKASGNVGNFHWSWAFGHPYESYKGELDVLAWRVLEKMDPVLVTDWSFYGCDGDIVAYKVVE